MISLITAEEPMRQQEETIRLSLADDGVFPNNAKVPLVLQRQIVSSASGSSATADALDAIFLANGWHPQWQGSLYAIHHYHATTHEAIGVIRGEAIIQFGGPHGSEIVVSAGDAIMIPAGVAHCLKTSKNGFQVLGAYPPGCSPDMCFGEPGERPDADDAIRKAPFCVRPSNGQSAIRLFL